MAQKLKANSDVNTLDLFGFGPYMAAAGFLLIGLGGGALAGFNPQRS